MSFKHTVLNGQHEYFVHGRQVDQAEYDRLWQEEHPWHEVNWKDFRFNLKGTENSFLGGRSQYEYEDMVGQIELETAKRAGINTHGKHYVSQLAQGRGPADPKAWVSDTTDMIRVAKERGLRLRGAVNYDPPVGDVKELPDIPLADDLVAEAVRDAIQENPDLAQKLKTKKGRQELKEAAIEKHAYKY